MAVFLRENGVLTMGSKTPVTILQETLQRKGLIPHYELIYNGVGSIDPIFKFQVSAAGFTAIGDGKSKKEAKHDAAAALLKRMQTNKAVTENSEVEVTAEIDIASPYSGALKQNFVGMLDETCVTNKIPLPVYVPIKEEGPPHARIFTMRCNVSSCTETAVARTKKQAKHMVAQQMINKIADILGDKYIPVIEKLADYDDTEEAQNLKEIENENFRHDLSIRVADIHNIFFHRTEEFLVPQMFLDLSMEPETFYEQLEKPKEFLDELLQGLEGNCKVISTSKTALQESLGEIEKDCQMFCLEDEDFEEEEEEEEIDSAGEDQDQSYLGKYSLKEFDLGEPGEENTSVTSNLQLIPGDLVKLESAKDKNIVSESCDKGMKQLEMEDSENNSSDSVINEEKLNSTKDEILSIKPIFLFLSIECPQGIWAFRGLGETCEEAVNKAAIEALKFLRVMSIPSNNKTVENNTV